jgi:hypothetical protein
MRRTSQLHAQLNLFAAQQDLRELSDEELKIAAGGNGNSNNSYGPYKDDPMVKYFLKHPRPPLHPNSVQ